jgi:hypothetical protein
MNKSVSYFLPVLDLIKLHCLTDTFSPRLVQSVVLYFTALLVSFKTSLFPSMFPDEVEEEEQWEYECANNSRHSRGGGGDQ